ncbi:A24 family peptidase [Massilia litorea]|uniref:Prepilin peptidase n=1 Tax=Massilia litorea TaxID=2769491 RepID=A0A7L9U9P1_9BURK|nr:A24 family peptidase [Massilia litorea]QOL51771.1 prepilin peptidase [Massilia litorea]
MPALIEITTGQLRLSGLYIVPIQIGVLVLLLLIATAVDIRERRIPNWLVATGMTGALAFHSISLQGEGAVFALSGLAVGMATLLPMYALGVMGAGDVKLMGMIGAFLGMDGVFGAVLASMAAGGLLALGFAACKRMLPQMFINLLDILRHFHIKHMTRSITAPMAPVASIGKMPYAVAITAGTLAQLTFLHL